MKTKLIVVSKIKSAPFVEESLEYLRRIKKMMPFELVEVPEKRVDAQRRQHERYCKTGGIGHEKYHAGPGRLGGGRDREDGREYRADARRPTCGKAYAHQEGA